MQAQRQKSFQENTDAQVIKLNTAKNNLTVVKNDAPKTTLYVVTLFVIAVTFAASFAFLKMHF